MLKIASTRKVLTESKLDELARRYEECETDLEDSDEQVSENEDEVMRDTDDDESDEIDTNEDHRIEANKTVNELPCKKSKNIILGKNKYKRYDSPFIAKSSRTLQKNIVLRLPGPIGLVKNATDELSTWKLFFDDEIITGIVTNTNREIARQAPKYKNQRFVHTTKNNEIYAQFGLLYLSGALSSNNLYTEEMSEKRFSFLLNSIRFDKETRTERRRNDKFAPIRQIFSKFIENCSKNYTPNEYVTVNARYSAREINLPALILHCSKCYPT
ncbi:piggybac transposable element-derived protein 4 [Holotrichia oblita]|uniref:Piggybac transposable element-derived protein 4 n=1 Tax=Holotrichia oblita TaxID=644536 RepID=A0ACB9SQD7_HOLOL|nr:piggybac transposable element-derived protein 4 [Holotrichia oblita]